MSALVQRLGLCVLTRLVTKLARRLFYSFAQSGREVLLLADISQFFPDRDLSMSVFELFDKDHNGDASRDEVEMACMFD